MKKRAVLVNPCISLALHVISRPRKEELEKIPQQGPFIIATNHINFLEVPLLYISLLPREIFGIIKEETWNHYIMAKLADLWEAIPIKRKGIDLKAMRKAGDVLAKGKILIIAPEGTRSSNGVLKQGQAGIVTLALQHKVPILPVAHYGGELFWSNIKKLRPTEITFNVGAPFTIEVEHSKVNAQIRKHITNEIMDRIAELLPAQYHGVYAHPEKRKGKYIKLLSVDSINI